NNKCECGLTTQAEPCRASDVNRESGTESPTGVGSSASLGCVFVISISIKYLPQRALQLGKTLGTQIKRHLNPAIILHLAGRLCVKLDLNSVALKFERTDVSIPRPTLATALNVNLVPTIK